MGSTRMKLHLAHQLAGDEHRPAFAGQAPQQVPDPADAVGVQPGRPAGRTPKPVMPEAGTPSVAYHRPRALPCWQVTAAAAAAFF